MGAGQREERRHSLWLWQLMLNTGVSLLYFWTRLQEFSSRHTQCRVWPEGKELRNWSSEAWARGPTHRSAAAAQSNPGTLSKPASHSCAYHASSHPGLCVLHPVLSLLALHRWAEVLGIQPRLYTGHRQRTALDSPKDLDHNPPSTAHRTQKSTISASFHLRALKGS